MNLKITVLTLGTRGDVQPYVALAKELLKNGHDVTICTGESFKEFIESNSIRFYKASIDFMAILESKEGQEIFSGGSYNIFKMLKFSKEVITPGYRKSMNDFLEASQNTNLIIYHPKALGAVDIAEYLNIPCICISIVPIIYPISEFPNFIVSVNKNLGKYLNKLTYKITAFGEVSYIKYINEFRVTCLNLKKRKSGMLMYKTNGQRIPIIYPLSQHIFQDVKSWGENVYISGFFFYNEDNQVMDEKLEKFICRGSKPIVISLSSTRLKNPERFQQNLIYSLKKTNNRAVILTGISGMNIKNEENIYVTEKSPHRLLFKRAKAIIHHGGAGTVSEALISGVPQIIIPFSADQPFWAYRLCKNNYAINLKNEKKATKDALIQALNDIEKEVYLENAEKIKDIVKLEKGIANAVKYIERTV